MQSEFFKRHQTNYEELQNKKLNKFYVVVQMVFTELLLREETILQPSKVTMLYGLDILGYQTIIGLYIENKEDNRYWLKEIEKVKQRGLRIVLYVSVEKITKSLSKYLK